VVILQAKGKDIVDGNKTVKLRGVNLGGWLNQEGFINGFAGSETEFRRAFLNLLGKDRYDAFFNAHLETFVAEKDFQYLAKIGMNAVRLPVNYRALVKGEDGLNYGDGFHYIDQAINWGKKYGVYIILDLHAAPGFQNSRWHSDNNASVSLLWNSQDFINQTVNIWKDLSDRYKDEAIVAGYDLLNEPETTEGTSLRDVYLRIIEAIRKNGDEHIVFLEGDRRGEDFAGLDDIPFSNVAYSVHFYIPAMFFPGAYPGKIGGIYTDKARIEKLFRSRIQWIAEQDKPCYVGEFGVVLDSEVPDLSADDRAKITALADAIDIMNKYDQHWTVWTYKDIRHAGFVNISPESRFAAALKNFIRLKLDLSVDPFISRKYGGVVSQAKAIVEEVASVVGRELADYSLDYNGLFKALGEQAIPLTVGNFLHPLYTKNFSLCTAKELGEIAAGAFSFDRCLIREELVTALKTDLK
jgi:hypothetical protein